MAIPVSFPVSTIFIVSALRFLSSNSLKSIHYHVTTPFAAGTSTIKAPGSFTILAWSHIQTNYHLLANPLDP